MDTNTHTHNTGACTPHTQAHVGTPAITRETLKIAENTGYGTFQNYVYSSGPILYVDYSASSLEKDVTIKIVEMPSKSIKSEWRLELECSENIANLIALAFGVVYANRRGYSVVMTDNKTALNWFLSGRVSEPLDESDPIHRIARAIEQYSVSEEARSKVTWLWKKNFMGWFYRGGSGLPRRHVQQHALFSHLFEQNFTNINKFERYQRDLEIHEVFPKKTDGTCTCGCGKKSNTAIGSEWASEACMETSITHFLIVKGDNCETRSAVYGRDKGVCKSCGASGGKWCADHIISVKLGGGACGLDNYQTLCVPCHRLKTNEERKIYTAMKIAALPPKTPKKK